MTFKIETATDGEGHTSFVVREVGGEEKGHFERRADADAYARELREAEKRDA